MKRLEQLVSATVARKLIAEIRNVTEACFAPPTRGGSLDELRDNIWEIYLREGIATGHPRAVVAAARTAYTEIFEQLAEQRGFGKAGRLRRRFLDQLNRTLIDDVRGYKKIDPGEYIPTREDLAKIKTITLGLDGFVDVASQLTGLEELELYGEDERERGLGKALAAAIPAPDLRRLTLNSTTTALLAGAIANPTWNKVDYLAI